MSAAARLLVLSSSCRLGDSQVTGKLGQEQAESDLQVGQWRTLALQV